MSIEYFAFQLSTTNKYVHLPVSEIHGLSVNIVLTKNDWNYIMCIEAEGLRLEEDTGNYQRLFTMHNPIDKTSAEDFVKDVFEVLKNHLKLSIYHGRFFDSRKTDYPIDMSETVTCPELENIPHIKVSYGVCWNCDVITKSGDPGDKEGFLCILCEDNIHRSRNK